MTFFVFQTIPNKNQALTTEKQLQSAKSGLKQKFNGSQPEVDGRRENKAVSTSVQTNKPSTDMQCWA